MPSNNSEFVYIGWDVNERTQIFTGSSTEKSKKLTEATQGILDFSVAPDGERIVFSTNLMNGENALWMMDIDGYSHQLVLSCKQSECSQPIWAVDGRRLIYEKRPIKEDGTLGSPYLWWLDMETKETINVLEDPEARGSAASFSPDGQWLSYFSPEEESVVFYNLVDGRSQVTPNEIGAPTEWSPQGERAILPNLDLVIIHGEEGDDHLEHSHDYESAVHLFSVDAASGDIENISGDGKTEDTVPAWAPDGEQIAFGRRFPGTNAGRQLWLMNSDGGEQEVLMDDPGISFGPPSWSMDGQQLLFQRFDMYADSAEPSIWVLDFETGQIEEVVPMGMQPVWVVEPSID